MGGTWARVNRPAALSSATYDAANRPLTFGGTTLTHDFNGNLTGDGTISYTWSARDRLASLSGAASASFVYDGLGRRQRKTVNGTTTDFHYDGLNPVREAVGANTVDLLTGLGIDEYFTRVDSASTRSVLSDTLGSTVSLVDSGGTVQTEYSYEPFGAVTVTGTSSGNELRYTGREDDATGVYYYRARYYHPGLQRFISEDPLYRFATLGGCSSLGLGSQRFNLYSYVENNPLSFTDPLGLEKRNCLGDYFTKCLPDCAILPGLTTAITSAGDLTANYYAAKAYVYAASKNLIYPLRSSVYRGFANVATKASPVSALFALNGCIYYCLYQEAKCERLF